MRRKILTTILILELIVICILFFQLTSQKAKNEHIYTPSLAKVFNSSQGKNKWKRYIQQVGTQKAYRDFIKIYEKSPSYYIRHNSLHYIGELLYEIDGMHGIAICDASFLYACYHGFFGAAIQNKGLIQIKQMDEACLQKTGPYRSACSHGIGHGILAYMGSKKLVKALDICDTLKLSLHTKGCKSGIFMEYNFNTITSHEGKQYVRPIGSSSPYIPCSQLESKHQSICYFIQTDWWEKIYNADYKKMGELCNNLSGVNKENCYLGIGNNALRTSNFDIQETLKKCDAIEPINENMLCKAGSAIRYKIQAEQENLEPKMTDEFCNSVQISIKKFCLEKSKILN